jgi:hypothetical protein
MSNQRRNGNRDLYEELSKIFPTSAAVDIIVTVAQITCPKRPNCEFRVLLRRFAANVLKRAKTSPRTLTRTDLAALT